MMPQQTLTFSHLITRSMRHFWRTNVALTLGIAVGTAVLTGALIVGDSIRGSLQSLTLQRLGRIDEILLGEQFFAQELAESLRRAAGADSFVADVVPAILLNKVTVEVIGQDELARKQGVTIVGCDQRFWDLDTSGIKAMTAGADQIVINQLVADELNVGVGDHVLLRIGKPSAVATDSPLARTDDLVKTISDLEIIQVIPAKGLGRFGMSASQHVPANAFVSVETLQRGLDQPGRLNAILVAGTDGQTVASDTEFAQLQKLLQPTLADLGMALKRVKIESQLGDPEVVAEYDSLSNDRMLFSADANDAVQSALQQAGMQPDDYQPAFTYLATRIQKVSASGVLEGEVVPYSTITAIDSVGSLGPLLDGRQPIEIGDDEIVLNRWATDVIKANVGDMIRVSYFEPETTHGEAVEQHSDFTLRHIVDITKPRRPFQRDRAAQFSERPTLANDPDLTPDVPGITDAETIAKWEAPFPIDYSLLDRRDDLYWENYRTTPKAFIALKAGQQLWDSRFGTTTSFRLRTDEHVAPDQRADELAKFLQPHAEAFGMRWLRVKADGLKASKGTTPFDALFLGFSMFIIASALMLVSLLLRLSLEQRASQLGLFGALGFAWKRSLRLLLAEHAWLTILGSLVGLVCGVAYAWLMLAGLRTWWLAAVVTPFMQLRVRPTTLLLGFAAGVLASLITIVVTMLRLRKVSTSRLLTGRSEQPAIVAGRTVRAKWRGYLPWALIGLALLLGAIAPRLAPEPQGGAFFGAGACVLAAALLWVSAWLSRAAEAESDGSHLSLQSLAARNLARNPGRSTLTIGLVAAACFLIVAISAFRLSPTDEGTGGFELVGTSDLPIVSDLQDAIVREDLSLQGPAWNDTQVIALRLQAGDDASCRNLYQSARPQLIGITPHFLNVAPKFGEMQWAGWDQEMANQADEPGQQQSAWNVLSEGIELEDGVIPVVLDKNTAMYSMQLYGGVGQEFERDYGAAGVLRFRVVGLLAGSIFQGSLLVRESDLLNRFPRVGGYRFFLVDCPNENAAAVSTSLESALGDQGLDLTDTKTLLTELLAVQNTYLSTFQSLGGLGLLLGTFGLAAVQLRNVMQRSSELALLRATGFRNDQISMLVLSEHAMLLFGGLAVGIVAAFVVILPHLLFGGASLPLVSLIVTLGLVALIGLASALVSQRYLSKTSLLDALRGD